MNPFDLNKIIAARKAKTIFQIPIHLPELKYTLVFLQKYIINPI